MSAISSFESFDDDDPTDLADDLNALPEEWQGGGRAHTGFAGALLDIWPQIALELQVVAGYSLLFTGHSLGAAMATLAASLQTPKSLYTFGSPRVGDAAFVATLEKKSVERKYIVTSQTTIGAQYSRTRFFTRVGTV